ncbi:hypothetical protein [Leptospira kirschneri]|uniref:Uncharacterized protein n=1 Tax=Leptospira kirschneri str. 200802841 TaxID=1193047 RepID=A0A828Y462_9LEPT|nr:hypothetical protein [Leptospira kirschneri]EMO78193.1 hypothetical protein LEP1GSC127_5125 [Leptospira kirschneri str. 200801925]EJO71168.1 hypothetical protein LEP1GSC044_4060 [Leptospira kirschneri serovar Grippotyphosa str. RM52]EKO51626.1 hypothetical protein LEP1GSC131_1698 [Leptospira kirschneri str. 200802841]EKQ85325.1 hypothetical protein LEP1GSC064_3450 [Leptospira kirschneri serovar Grippotyphosa str. Moskva]EKR06481.1 hypothetical protein LEP1GSC122_0416 [Leptospira kirschneri 
MQKSVFTNPAYSTSSSQEVTFPNFSFSIKHYDYVLADVYKSSRIPNKKGIDSNYQKFLHHFHLLSFFISQ